MLFLIPDAGHLAKNTLMLKDKLLLLVLLIAISSCSQLDPVAPQLGPNASQDNPEVEIIPFSVRHLTSSVEWTYFPFEEVNILDYRDVDSVRFSANMRSQDYYENCIVELYDFTNDRPIRNSTVKSNVRFYFKYVESNNILPGLPLSEALLGVRVRSSREGNPVEIAYDSQIMIFSH